MASNPILGQLLSQLEANPGVTQNISLPVNQVLQSVHTNSTLNQIRGTGVNNATSSGIPKQVTNVVAIVSQASTGTTSKIVVTFHRDPSDKAYSSTAVWVKGYQGNANPVNVATSAESPATFVLNNTGENLSIIAQATGNSGNAPLNSSPTTGVSLPKSTVSGYGTSTSTAYTPATPPPAGVTFNGTPHAGDIIRYNVYGDNAWDVTSPLMRVVHFAVDDNGGSGGGISNFAGIGNFSTPTGAGTLAGVAATATEGFAVKFPTTSTPASFAGFFYSNSGAAAGRFILGTFRRFAARATLNQITTSRFFIGLTDSPATNFGPASSDVPNANTIAFRYSTTTDSSFVGLCSTTSALFTATSTGVAPTTSVSQLFEIVYDGTKAYFLVNGTMMATISTNLPVNTTLMNMFAYIDNKSTANAVSFNLQEIGLVAK